MGVWGVCAVLLGGVAVLAQGDRVVFGGRQEGTCLTIGGPSLGQQCVFPFGFGGKVRTGCITDQDPEGKHWCSTKVDSKGNHVPASGEWGHCGSQCPGVPPLSPASPASPVSSPLPPSSSSSSSSSGSPSGSGQLSSAFTVGTVCSARTGVEGTCRLPTLCIGASLEYIENNPCVLQGGEEGVCCVDISIDNIISITDSPSPVVDIPTDLDTQGIFLRFDAGVRDQNPHQFASLAPAEGVTIDTNFIEDPEPSNLHLRFNSPRKDIVRFDQDSQILLEATRRIKSKNNLTDLEASIGLRNDFNSDTNSEIRERCPWVPGPSCPSVTEKYRTFDGSCNNPKNSNFGRTGTPFQRILLPDYAQGTLDLPRRSSVGNSELPSARLVSNTLSGGTDPPDTDNTVLVMQMGQFIDHDITHTPNHGIQCCGANGAFPASFDAEKCSPIRISSSDPFWKGKKTCMNFARSLSSPSLKCGLQTREQLNQITHWMDGSNIYGSTEEDAQYLRASGGKLKESRQSTGSQGSLPSCAREPSGKVTGCDVCGSRKKDCFFAGDFRVNEQLNLIVLHTLFMREHNRLATELKRMNPRWNDETLYQEARRINIAQYQHIVFKEWLPIIIGNNFMKSYGLFPLSSGFSTDYKDNFDPRINNEFSTAAFRFGHSMIPNTFSSVDRGRSETTLNMREIFFRPASMKKSGFMDSLLRGMTEQGSQLWDSSFVEDVRNHLFESTPGRGGLDLVAVNIQRGRDHGLPGYNKYREICTGKAAKDWNDLRKSMKPRDIELMRQVYKSVDDIDLYLGGFLEAAHEDSILGPVFKCIIGDQFARLKKGDKFFYDLGVSRDRAFTLPQLDQIRQTSMARIICDNSEDVDRIQPLAFKMPTSRANAVRLCSESSIPRVSLAVFDGKGATG